MIGSLPCHGPVEQSDDWRDGGWRSSRAACTVPCFTRASRLSGGTSRSISLSPVMSMSR